MQRHHERKRPEHVAQPLISTVEAASMVNSRSFDTAKQPELPQRIIAVLPEHARVTVREQVLTAVDCSCFKAAELAELLSISVEAAIRVQALARNSAEPILTAIGTAANRRLNKQEVFVPVPVRTHKTWLKIIAGERFSQVSIVPANEVRRPCAATDRKAHFLQIIFDVAIALGTAS